MKIKLYYVVKIDYLHNSKPKFIAGPFSFEQAVEHPLYQTGDDQMRGKPRPSQLAAQQLGGEAA